jgi:hypothetical protein
MVTGREKNTAPPLLYRVSTSARQANRRTSRIMSPRSEDQNEMPNARDGRRRELRELLVSAANAARQTRQNSLSATLSRAVPEAVRERVAIFLAAAR